MDYFTIPPTPTTPPDIEFAPVGDEEDEEESQVAEDTVSVTSASNPVMELVSTVTERHDYIYAGGKLLRETITTTAADGTVTTKILDFAYDAQGTPYSLTCTNGTATPETYYYITNLQGDVTYLINGSGTTVARYSYDPYGQIQLAFGSMAEVNPLRYRGYYYDSDTEFYYLQSRYYDAIICRFINADSYSSTGQGILGYNMFAYCNNSPIVAADSDGEWLNIVIGAVVGAVINVVVAVVEQKPVDEVIVSGICGAVSGGLTAAGFGTVAGAVSSFVDSAYGNTKAVMKGEKTMGQAIVGTMVDTAVGTAFGAMGSGSAADIAKSNQISSAGWKGAKTLLSKGVYPAVKKAAKKSAKVALKYTLNTLCTEFASGGVSTGISKGISWFTDRVYQNYASAF